MKFAKTLLLSLLLVVSLNAREQVNANFANLKIEDFIKLVSKVTQKNILVNNKITGTVDFVSTTAVYDDELMGILISVLESKGFTLVQNGSLYEIVHSTEAAKSNLEVVGMGSKLYGSLMVTQSIPVRGENVDIVAAKIRYLISKNAKLMTMKESNTILLTDYPKNIETIKRVIDDIDTNNQATVTIVPILHAEPKKLQTRVVEISKSIFNEKVDGQQVKVILDENINGLILVGIPKNVKKLQGIIENMDVESKLNSGIEIYHLKNSDAKIVATTLNDIISKQTFADPLLKPNVAPSEEINAVIAIGEPVILKGLKAIVDELDKEQYQVYVQARIVEINQNDSSSIGMKYGLAAGDVSASGLYAMSANFGSSPLTGAASGAVMGSLGSIGDNAKKAFALGATLDFLEENGASKSISNPSILCLNNKESSIYVGRTISISTGSISSAMGTGAGVGAALSNSFKREDVGLTLKIKPRVSSSDKVTLDVEAILENVLDDGSNNATGQPVTSKQEVKTQAILGHGESIIIGGLVKVFDRDSVSKVPLLGDIPLIGEYLFSSVTKSEQKDNLVVILTPFVIDKSENLSQLQQDLGVLAKIQADYSAEAIATFKARQPQDDE